MLCTRRVALQVAALAAFGGRSLLAQTAGPTIVDTHTHFYDPRRPEGVPWPAPDDKFLYRPVLPGEYRTMTRAHGVVGTVVVEASPRVADNDWVLDLGEKDPFVLGLVGNLAPGSAEFSQHFDRLVKRPKFLGIRVNSGPLGAGLEKPEYLADLKKLAEAGKELDVNGRPDLLPIVAQLAKKLPTLRIVINHLANVRIDGPMLDATWLKDLQGAAKQPQVSLKVSALVEGASQGGRKPPEDPEYYRPVLTAAWDAFGDDRVIYGSNWPVSARFADYAVVQKIVQNFAVARGPEASRKFFSANALAAYQWPTG